MAVEKWIAGSGVGFTWTAAFTTGDLTSLANGSSILATSTITNQTALDIFCDLSFNLATLTTVAPSKLDFFLYPLNQDATTYGDGQLTAGSQAAVTPSPSLQVATFLMLPIGAGAKNGTMTGLVMPPGTFKFALQNNAGVNFSASTNAISYRTYNRSVA